MSLSEFRKRWVKVVKRARLEYTTLSVDRKELERTLVVGNQGEFGW